MATVLLLTLILTLSLGILTPFVSSDPPDEVHLLSTFRQALSDPDNKLESWDPSLYDPCTWFHITCNAANRVIRIDLGLMNLSGKLVPELGDLSDLDHLELYQNKLEGTIPAELGKLMMLVSLDLYENNLSGGLPSSLENLKSLGYLRVNDNKLLSGVVPKGVLGIQVLNITNTGLRKPSASRPFIVTD